MPPAIGNTISGIFGILQVILLVLIHRQGLSRRLPAFAFYLWASFLSGAGLLALSLMSLLETNAYAIAYWASIMLLTGSSMYAAYSFWRAGLAKYRGFHRLCVSLVALMIGGLTVAFAYLVEHSVAPSQGANFWLNQWFSLMTRSINFMNAALLLLFFAVIALFRIEISRTVRDFAMVLFVFSLGKGILRSLEAMYPHPVTALSLAGLAVLLFANLTYIRIAARHQVDEAVETAPVFALSSSREDLEARMQTMNHALIRILG